MQGLCVFLLRHVNFVTPDKIQIHSCSTVIIVAYECVPSKMRAHGYSWCVVDTGCRGLIWQMVSPGSRFTRFYALANFFG